MHSTTSRLSAKEFHAVLRFRGSYKNLCVLLEELGDLDASLGEISSADGEGYR